MTHSPGGYVPGTVQVWLRPGPAREGLDDRLTIYEDECIINRRGVCIRNYQGHASLPIPEDRTWSCPAHGDPAPTAAGTWVRRANMRTRHHCATPSWRGGALGDLWRCDQCRRLWRVAKACDVCDRRGTCVGRTGSHQVGYTWRPATFWQWITHRRWRS